MPTLVPLTLANAAEAARIHALAMAGGLGGPGWRKETFETLLLAPSTFGWLADEAALIMLRHAGDEAEVFTIGVAPAARGRGLARCLLATAYITLGALNVPRLLLEVAVDNAPAISLYRSDGFREVGRRPRYYKRGAARIDALVLARTVSATP